MSVDNCAKGYRWQEAVDFVLQHAWIYADHANDFFAREHTRAALDDLFPVRYNIDDLIDMVHSLEHVSGESRTLEFLRRCADLSLVHAPVPDGIIQDVAGQRPLMKAKKSHEVDRLAPFIVALARDLDIRRLVDVGAGQGYLDFELLDLLDDPKYSVTAVEHDPVQLRGIVNRQPRPRNINVIPCSVNHETRLESFESLIHDNSYILYSLHACGSLSDDMIRLFSLSNRARALVNVGCCYNRISSPFSFPLSNLLKSTNLSLNDTLKMAACQAPRRWFWQREDTHAFHEKNYFRAVLQVLLNSLYGTGERIEIGRLRPRHCGTFASYARAAFAKIGRMEDLGAVDLARVEAEFRPLEDRLALFWTLKAALGQVVESLILFDRYQYMIEQLGDSASVKLVPLFDMQFSPRRLAVVCIRKK